MEHPIPKKSLKICLVSTTPYPGVYFPELRSIAFELEKAGKNVVIIAAKQLLDDPDFEIIGKKRVHRLPFFRRFEQEIFFMRCASIIRKENPSILHIFWRMGAALLPLILRRKKILFINDIRTGSVQKKLIKRIIENTLIKFESRFFNHLVTLNEDIAKKIFWHIPKNMHYVPMGFTAELFKQNDRSRVTNLMASLSLVPEDRIGIYVGTSYARNLEILLYGFSNALTQNNHLKLIIIGDAKNSKSIQIVIQEKRLEKNVVLLASIHPNEVPAYLSLANYGIAFVPKTPGFTNQQSTKILEYMAANLPILATSTISNKKFVIDNQNGIIINDTINSVEYGIARMMRLLDQCQFTPEKLERINCAILNEYNWGKIVQTKLLPLYETNRL